MDGVDAAIEADDAESVFEQLSTGDNERFESAMFDACDAFNRQLFGIDGVSANGVDAASMDLAVLGPIVDFSIAGRDAFVAGDHTTICVASWTDFDDEERTVAYPEGIGLEDYATAEFPTDLHVCATSVEFTNTFQDCAEPHEAQQLLSFNGVDVVGADWIATVNPDDLSVPNYDVPDAGAPTSSRRRSPACRRPAGSSGRTSSPAAVDGQDFDGTVDPDAGYYFSCELVAPS